MGNTTNSGADCQSAVESQQTGTIYLLTCTVNGKQYVGQTRQKLSQRIYKHRYESKRGRPGVDAAIRKHGWENFTVDVLETCPVECSTSAKFSGSANCKPGHRTATT